jgi:nucleotide-binding universal stress UspA family protein
MHAHPFLLKTTRVSDTTRSERQPEPVLLRGSGLPRQTILLPVDGTPASARAVDYVLELARYMPLSVHLLNVQRPVTAGDITIFRTARAVELERRAEGERALGSAKGALTAAGIRYVAEVALGSAADEIVRCATTSGCSKIVMGTGRGGTFGTWLGRSVSRRVSKRAPVPVTVVPARARFRPRQRTRTGVARPASATANALAS